MSRRGRPAQPAKSASVAGPKARRYRTASSRRAASRSCAGRSPSQAPAWITVGSDPRSGPKQVPPSAISRRNRWVRTWAVTSIPSRSTALTTSSRVRGSPPRSRRFIVASARSCAAGSTPKWARRRRASAPIAGSQSGTIHAASSAASRCIVVRIAQARTTERSSLRARSTSAAVGAALRARSARRPCRGSWAWAPAIARRMSAGCRGFAGRWSSWAAARREASVVVAPATPGAPQVLVRRTCEPPTIASSPSGKRTQALCPPS